jgi:hypothetical protein
MTQQFAVQAPPPEPVDNLRKMLVDLERDRKRIGTTPPQDISGVVREILGTVLAYQKEAIEELRAHRDWTSGVVGDIDARIEDLESQASGGGTQFLPEDAEKFKALAMGVDFLILTIANIPGAKMEGEIAVQLGKLKTLATECLSIIEESTIEEDDGDDDEEDDGEPGAEDTEGGHGPGPG